MQPYSDWLRKTGVSKVTGWRWRQNGWLNAVNISGKLYVSDAEISRFTQRAAAGEFAQSPSGAAAWDTPTEEFNQQS
ncbi:MAG: hypothetical protein ACPGVU_04080 [Limisphaerales bacterium]